MHYSISHFGSIPRNRLSCVCDIAPCGMEPVIHRCHLCIGGEVVADSSNQDRGRHLLSRNVLDPPESRDAKGWCSLQRSSSILVCIGGTAKRSISLFTPSHDCRCTNAILRKHVCSLSSFDGRDTATRFGSFYTLHSFTGRWWCVEKALHHIYAGSRCPSFCRHLDVLTSHDIASNLHSGSQRTLSQSDRSEGQPFGRGH